MCVRDNDDDIHEEVNTMAKTYEQGWREFYARVQARRFRAAFPTEKQRVGYLTERIEQIRAQQTEKTAPTETHQR